MENSAAVELLDILIGNSSRILLAGFGLRDAESAFFGVVDLLREVKGLKPCFLDRVGETFSRRALGGLGQGEVPVELIELVAHELRWPELIELARRRLDLVFHGDTSLAVGDIAVRLPLAYVEQWEDREFYRRYGFDENGKKAPT